MTVWDVAARPADEQFGFWREVICEAFVPLTPARMERAAALLAGDRGSATITEIAASVGFDGPASFSRAFRREFGRTPSEVRAGGRVPARTAQDPGTN